MQALDPLAWRDSVVLTRTAAGQQEVVENRHALTDAQRLLLLLVNSYTPLDQLATRLPPDTDVQAAAQALQTLDFVAEVDPVERDFAESVSPAFI